ncbi:tumor necrosis factor receptor superfamily member 6B-like [Enoplosus armatus]|uniref:tumor necrosis factor receptor superfamily member 6B-like n=1 Tax=Enoplosus armatus TaxID=215367 RepID=UPI0039953B26
MHIISMLLVPALFLLSGVLRGVSADKSVPTYERRDVLTGETLICDKCPPGTHMAEHCTATTPTECEPCSEDHFTEYYNYLPRCLYCSNFCFDNKQVEKECTAVSNRVCRCKEGYYMTGDYCMKHSECEPGHGVHTKGTPQTDTVCEKCSEGSFSSSSSALDSCVNHQECASGEIVLLPGSIYKDAVCGTCEDLANGGETHRTFLAELFSRPLQRKRLPKMKKFVRHIHKSGEERRTSGRRGPLLRQIREWLAQAPVEELNKLPQMLRAAQLSSMVENLEKTLNEIELQNCTLTR